MRTHAGACAGHGAWLEKSETFCRTETAPEGLPTALRKKNQTRPRSRSHRAAAGVPRRIGAHYANESVPAAEFRTDQIAVRFQCFAQCRDLKLEILFRHGDAWPHAAHEPFFVTSEPSASNRTSRRSKARVPSSTGTSSANSCRRRNSTRKRPNSRSALVVACRERFPASGSGFRRRGKDFGRIFGCIVAFSR